MISISVWDDEIKPEIVTEKKKEPVIKTKPEIKIEKQKQKPLEKLSIPIIEIEWLIETARSRFQTGLPRCPACNNRKYTCSPSELKCLSCGKTITWKATPSFINTFRVEEWLNKNKEKNQDLS